MPIFARRTWNSLTLRQADLQGARFEGARLGEAQIDTPQFLPERERTLWEVLTLGGAEKDLHGVDWHGLDLSGVELWDVDPVQCKPGWSKPGWG